jgi:hypothetical protein
MADGSLVSSSGIWTGYVIWGPIHLEASFKVFPSRGSWHMLIGKPLLEQSSTIQDYSKDSIIFASHRPQHSICNIAPFQPLPRPCLPTVISFPSIATFPTCNTMLKDSTNIVNTGEREAPQCQETVLQVGDVESSRTLGEVPEFTQLNPSNDIFTRLMLLGPFYPPWVEMAMNTVCYGPQLEDDQCTMACSLIEEFADIFALSTREVKQVDFIKFRLSMPPDMIFSKKIHQHPLMQPQQKYLFPILDEMRKVGITRFIPADEVKAVASMVLIQKTHSSTSLSLDDIRHIVNQQCIELSEPLDLELELNSTLDKILELVDLTKVK